MIRRLEKEDLDQVMEIWLKGNQEAHDFISEKYWESHISEVQKQLLQAEVYVCEEEGKIKGFVGMQGEYLAGIFVEQKSRSLGIGRLLLDQAKRSHPVLSLNVYEKNERALKFYQREGFVVISKRVDEDTGEMDCTMFWKK